MQYLTFGRKMTKVLCKKSILIYDILHKDLDAFRTHLAKSFQDFDLLPHNQRTLDLGDYYIQQHQFQRHKHFINAKRWANAHLLAG